MCIDLTYKLKVMLWENKHNYVYYIFISLIWENFLVPAKTKPKFDDR